MPKVISGGQVGADIAGLRAGKALGLLTGGWMPKGFRAKDKFHPEYAALYGIQELPSLSYPPRTLKNALASDATVRFAYNFDSRGERCTLRACARAGRPHFDIDLKTPKRITPTDFAVWLYDHDVAVLNVAGNADPAIEGWVQRFLMQSLPEVWKCQE